ncbi:hypothetical protein [Mesomycoplasma molare]|uniref:Uncharacterized protein n=1 Tax=Mesomycoplasma molare TaxID=171288 RepID=A0ABY5TTR3_9BACT|nr:hypothetical protein [Mesomycoplasma molare]UWD34052.1 hypothetical protein NX772_03015 [Mesomycoplasma molare]
MDVRKLSKNLKLIINGDDRWAFNNKIHFSYHVTNYSKVIIHNVIHKDILEENSHFINHPYLSNIDTFSLATITSNDKPVFTGIISSQGRYSLNPKKIKDSSIEIVDIRYWLNKKTPADIVFKNIPPARALQLFIDALEEPKIKAGKLSFSNNTNITAYDTTSKSPYSILKDIIATQTRSFLYFSQNESGDLLINFESEHDFKSKEAIEITENNWSEHKILDLVIEENTDNYFNKVRLESENIIANKPLEEYFTISNTTKSIWTSEPVEKVVIKEQGYKNTYFNIENSNKEKELIVLEKKDYSKGKDFHLYYKRGDNELVINPEWDRESVGIYFSYYSKNKQAITLENTQEISRINALNTFSGDVYKYEQNNDISTFSDLFKQAEGQLLINSTPRRELKLSSAKTILNLGDVIILNYDIPKIDGRYIVIAYEGTYTGSTGETLINYTLRNGLNGDTLINFYDSTDYKINPFFEENQETILYKYRDKSNHLAIKNKLNDNKDFRTLSTREKAKMVTALPYVYKKEIVEQEVLEYSKKETFNNLLLSEE